MENEERNESSYSKAAGSIKKTIRRAFIAIIVLVIFGVGFVGWSFYAAIYKWQSPAAVDVEIEQGMTGHAIAQRLYENGVIKTPTIFSYYVRLRGVGEDVKAGEYEFPAGINAENVLTMLVKGQVRKYQLQIIEGWTIKDIVKYLSTLAFLKDPAIPADFERLTADRMFIESLGFKDVPTLEGYLFPDTYEVFRPKSADEIIKKMIARFREVYTP
ncbi:MAG: endolytic transglycosylase MltG, partial [Candidatus Dadabacteria bacterium]|nr:endolytic transglycosylase MltG [Candidatus Dadabacteria bacterium]